ncbi:MAG: hypothetical protein AAFQ99_01030 [Pseudomonadota bacterium]
MQGSLGHFLKAHSATLDNCASEALHLSGAIQNLGVLVALDADSLLGALYVAHGAQFGRPQLRAAIEAGASTRLPEYLTLPIDQVAWRRLLTKLEEIGAEPERFRTMVAGAKAAFRHYRAALDAATPYRHQLAHSPR